jgi:hypothetical protein
MGFARQAAAFGRQWVLALAALTTVTVGCGSAGPGSIVLPGENGDGGPGSTADAVGTPSPGSGGPVTGADGGTGGPGPGTPDGSTGPVVTPDMGAPQNLLYAHTDTTLYKVDPSVSPFTLQPLGDFSCIGPDQSSHAMTDLAVDKRGNLMAVTGHNLYPLIVAGGTVTCGEKISLQGSGTTYALAYAPEGVLAPQEMLIAANSAGEVWAIDDQGVQTQIGSLGVVPADDGRGHSYDPANVGKAWELSGDLFIAANNGNPIGFATVRDCPNPPDTTGCSRTDTLVELDVSKLRLGNTGSVLKRVAGQAVPAASCNTTERGFGSMYGIAAYQDKVYGFSRHGDIVEMDNTTGAGCTLQNQVGMSFSGAAATTVIPVVAPHPEG